MGGVSDLLEFYYDCTSEISEIYKRFGQIVTNTIQGNI